ncbi:MAG: transporter substrate-binding protein [Geminicoccaceae bacterium]|nr:transporter substrate-binding protein [Geminicoccaceae bacterium]
MRFRHLCWACIITALLALSLSFPAYADRLQDILDEGVVRIGVPIDVPPFGFTDQNQQPVGLDVDLAGMVAKELGVELEMQQITGINRIPFLLTDKVDVVIAVMGATPERARQIMFTSPYASLYIGVFGPRDLPVTSAAEIGDHSVGVPRGTTQDISISEMAPDANIVRFEDDATTAAAYLSGQVDLFGTANILVQDMVRKDPSLDLVNKFVIRTSPAHMGVRHGEFNLLRWLDTFIFYSKMNGSLQQLHQKWLGEDMKALPSF